MCIICYIFTDFVVLILHHKHTIMSINSAIKLIAGSFIIISVLLAHYVDERWLFFTLFVGANLVQSSLTNWCMMEKILKKLGMREGGDTCSI